MKSLLNPSRSFFSGQLRSQFAWLATAGALFPAAACSDAGLDVGNDSRGVNSHEEDATDESSGESAGDESDGTPMETPAPDVSVEGDDEMPAPENPAANPNPVESPGTTPNTMEETPANPNPVEIPEVPGDMVLVPTTPAPTSAGAMCSAGFTLCAAECVDVSSDPLNCGACGLACMSGDAQMSPPCQQGVCVAESLPIEPSFCGDGFLDMGSESCDDGNAVEGDGCSAMCTVEEMFVCPTGQPCTSICGNGIVEQEACDDGNVDPGDGCDSTCATEPGFSCTIVEGPSMNPDAGAPDPNGAFSQCAPLCGDGIVAADEECDPGVAGDTMCNPDCTLPI